jgi:transposase-like protein
MTINQQAKAVMDAANSLPDSAASQGARRATGDEAESAAPVKPSGPDTQVVPRAQRRHLSNANKRRILEAAARCTKPGELGALMRREGVYSSSLSTWRRQLEAAELAALAPQKRGPKIDPARVDAQQIAQITRERDKLRIQLDKANLVIAVQKKVAGLLALLEQDDKPESN